MISFNAKLFLIPILKYTVIINNEPNNDNDEAIIYKIFIVSLYSFYSSDIFLKIKFII